MNMKYDPRVSQMMAALCGDSDDLTSVFTTPTAPSAFEPRLSIDTQDRIGNYFHDVRAALVALNGLRPDQAAIVVGRNAHSIVGGWNVGRTAEQTAHTIAPNVRKVSTGRAGCW